MSELLDRDAVLALLSELGARLAVRGVEAEIYVVDGTAMVLAYDRTRLTRDVDAVTEDQQIVEQEAVEMAAERGDLSRDWFNGRVRPMLPRVLDVERIEAFSAPGISVSVASPRHMLAMKVRAARDARDLEDVAILCGLLGLTSTTEVIAVADEVWGPGMLRDESVFVVTSFLRDRGFTD
jgi:hypothetical protein